MLKAPFPYFGGKRRVADEVWRRFGDVRNYVEPFFGSGAVLLGRPTPFDGVETVNDLDSMLANFWRALQADPEKVADYADWPVNEVDLYARHCWLQKRKPGLTEWIRSDPEAFDAKAAGWWVWGISQWIGGGFCNDSTAAQNKIPYLREGAMGVCRKMPYLDRGGRGGQRHMHLGRSYQIHSRLPYLWTGGRGVLCNARRGQLRDYFNELAQRLRYVRVCCGDFERVLGPTPTFFHGLTGVFLDPPYCANRHKNLYVEDSMEVSARARAWAIENGTNPLLRIALCGYEGEHEMPADWAVFAWKTAGGYARQGNGNGNGIANASLERMWFSPACVMAEVDRTGQLSIFEESWR